MQQPIDKWFATTSNNESPKPKTIFYFDAKKMETKWLHQQLNHIRFSTIIKWNKKQITLCTNMSQNHDYQIPTETKYNSKHITFLKSNLQKCIRRGLAEKAVKTAYHMIKINLNEFLRRISIIILEDITLHQAYSTVVWLTAATSSKKNIFKPNKYIIDWLLGFVNLLCHIEDYDNAGKNNKTYDLIELNDNDLLYSLQFRRSYGGMSCDMKMLDYFTDLWFKRFSNNEKCDETEIELIDSNNIKDLEFEEWKLEDDNCVGIDFHCAPYIITNLQKKYDYTETEIKLAIWNCSSKINYRKENKPCKEDLEIWNKIKEDYFKEHSNILSRYMK